MAREWQKIEDGRVTDSTTDPEVVKAWMMAGFDVRSVGWRNFEQPAEKGPRDE